MIKLSILHSELCHAKVLEVSHGRSFTIINFTKREKNTNWYSTCKEERILVYVLILFFLVKRKYHVLILCQIARGFCVLSVDFWAFWDVLLNGGRDY